MFPTNWKYMI